jgi:hypothetical protein
MATNEPKNIRLQNIEKTVEELKKAREESHININKSLEEYKKEREDFYNKIAGQLSGLKKNT